MNTSTTFVATYNHTSDYNTMQYRFGHALITSFQDFKKFCDEQCLFQAPDERLQSIYNKIVTKDFTLYAGKNWGFVHIGGSCNPQIQVALTGTVTTPYVITNTGNIVAMVNGVETYINPKTGVNNPVEKPCFHSLTKIQGVHFIDGGVTEILNDLNKKVTDAAKRKAEKLAELQEPCKGWYVVTLEAVVSVTRGNDGVRTYSYKVLAESQYDAFDKASAALYNKIPKGVDFIYNIKDNVFSALIEYVGVWTDEAELEYGAQA